MKAHPSVQPLYKCCAHVGIPWGVDFCFCLSETAEPRALGLKLSTGLGGWHRRKGSIKDIPVCHTVDREKIVEMLWGFLFLLAFLNWSTLHALKLMLQAVCRDNNKIIFKKYNNSCENFGCWFHQKEGQSPSKVTLGYEYPRTG